MSCMFNEGRRAFNAAMRRCRWSYWLQRAKRSLKPSAKRKAAANAPNSVSSSGTVVSNGAATSRVLSLMVRYFLLLGSGSFELLEFAYYRIDGIPGFGGGDPIVFIVTVDILHNRNVSQHREVVLVAAWYFLIGRKVKLRQLFPKSTWNGSAEHGNSLSDRLTRLFQANG